MLAMNYSPANLSTSDDGRFSMVLGSDGNFVVYRGTQALWGSNTSGHPVKNAIMQGDGNLVLFSSASATAVWASGTVGHAGSILKIQNDGNAVIYQGAAPIWSTQTDGTGDILVGKTFNPKFRGVYGENTGGGDGVFGYSHTGRGVVGVSEQGIGIFAQGDHLAGHFQGDVEVTGDIRLTNADCAEDFNIGAGLSVEPGTVMVLGEEGALFPSLHAYDKRVAGVISGAGGYKPGIVLDKQESGSNRQPVALLGKVFCKVDARYGAIEVGDLLTTSPTPGHAMKACDPLKAFGAVIGKALRPLTEGQGLIPILIALQ
jgi:hypothetical protein